MKRMNLLSLAFVAAVALTASMGAGSAAATELCSNATTPCSGTKYGTETALISPNTTNTVIQTSLTTVTCTISEVNALTTSAGGSTTTAVTAVGTSLTFSGCTRTGGEPCSVSGIMGNASITGGSASGTSKFNYNVTSTTSIHTICGFFINCGFSTSSATLSGQNGFGYPTIKAEGLVLKREGGFCPETASWTGAYQISSPSPLYVV
jgi:hypothetical protein